MTAKRHGKLMGGMAAVAVSAMLAVGCGSSGGSNVSSGAKLTKLVEVVGDPTLSATIAFQTSVPQELGYFRQEGLDVQVQGVSDSNAGVALVAAGKADVIQAGSNGMFQLAGPNPNNLVIVYLNYGNSFRVDVPANSPIKTAADLRGKTIGTTSLTSALYYYGRAVVAQAGLNPDKDVKWLPVGSGAQAAAAMKSGTIQAYAGADFYNLVIGNLLSTKMRDISAPSNALGAFAGWLFRRSMVEKDPHAVIGFVRAYLKGMIFSSINPKAAVQIHWKVFPNSEPQTGSFQQNLDFWANVVQLRLNLDYIKKGPGALWGTASNASIEKSIDFQLKYGLITQKPGAVSDWVDLSLASKYNDFDVAAVEKQARDWKP